MRGRVTCGLAIEDTETRGPRDVKLILNSPKPSYYPFYVRQDMEPNGQVRGDWRGYAPPAHGAAGPEIRGWKRYPARSDAWQPPPHHAPGSLVAGLFLDPDDLFEVRVGIDQVLEAAKSMGDEEE